MKATANTPTPEAGTTDAANAPTSAMSAPPAEPRRVTRADALRTYLPLSAMWILMGIEQPALTAVIARLSDATAQLGAFGVTFVVALIVESPIIQMLAAGTAMAKDRAHYRRLLRFMHGLAIVLTSLHLVLSLPWIYEPLLRHVVGVPENLIGPSQAAFFVMLPWAASVGYRRLWQGVLIRYGKAKVVPITMVVRLITTFALLYAGFVLEYAGGAQIAAVALIGGVIAGAVSSYMYVRPVIRTRMKPGDPQKTVTFAELMRFYLPLAGTSVVVLVSRPILTFGIARAPNPVPSLAVWPVIMSFNFILFSQALALQEAIVALLRRRQDFAVLKRFSMNVSMVLGAVYLLVVLTPMRDIWFGGVVGLEPHLLELVFVPAVIMALSPAIGTFVFFYRGVQVQQERTGSITRGVLVNVVTLMVVLFGGSAVFPAPGVVTAASAYVIALFLEVLYLRYYSNHSSLVLAEIDGH
ncbi:MAG: hypothetical protein ACQETQ_05225 [Spirochaetota bacterium]